jgi:hypothetical protein
MRASCTFIIAFIVTTARAAVAQDANAEAQAQRLFDEGRALMDQGRYAEACAKLLASEHAASSGGTLLNLADCYEKDGKPASAWVRFREAAARAAAAGKKDIEAHALDRAKALAPQLSTLTIVVPPASDVTGLVLRRDGTVIERGAWGTPLPVDPGTYGIDASAAHRVTWATRVAVKSGADRVTVVVPVLDEDKTARAPAPAGGEGWPAGKTVGLALGIGGVIGVGLGSFFGLRAASLNDDAKSHCPESPRCLDAEGPALTKDAQGAATISTVALIAGAALLVSGAVLWFTAPSRAATTAASVR